MTKKVTLLEHALEYATIQQFAVFPLIPRSKKPMTEYGVKDATKDVTIIKQWWTKEPHANIGIATGALSGILVIDVDMDEEKGKNGRATINEFERTNGKLPLTWMSKTGRGGYHIFYKTTERIKNRVNVLPSIDIRGDGGYIVAPPSIHENGNVYQWLTKEKLSLNTMTPLVYQLCTGTGQQNIKSPTFFTVEEQIIQGNRTNAMFKLVSSLIAKGLSEEAIKAAVRIENQMKCKPPLTERDLEKEIFPAMKRYSYGTNPYYSTQQKGGEEQRNQNNQTTKQDREREQKRIQLLTEKKRLLNYLKSINN